MFVISFSVWAKTAALITLLLKLENWLLYELFWVASVYGFNNLENVFVFFFFCTLSGFAFCLFILELTHFPYSLTSYPFEILRYFLFIYLQLLICVRQ